jgi:hypothetical protein
VNADRPDADGREFEDGGPVHGFSTTLPEGGEIRVIGLTVRDHFAAQAMQALLAKAPSVDIQLMLNIAKKAYQQADAMLVQRRVKVSL